MPVITKAIKPWPRNLAVKVDPTVGPDGSPYFHLSWVWQIGDDFNELPAANVFFGTTNPPAKKLGTTYSSFWPPDPPALEQQETAIRPGMRLAMGTVYYWRVDIVTPTGGGRKGDVWSFTTMPGRLQQRPSKRRGS
jgi:hypothetical protein